MSKKLMLGVAVALAAGLIAIAANIFEAYSCSTTNSGAYAAVPAHVGVTPVAKSFNYSVQTASTITIIRPCIKVIAAATASDSTNVYIHTTSDGKVNGYTILSSDYIVFPASGDSNMTYGLTSSFVTNGQETNLYIKIGVGSGPHNIVSNQDAFIAKALDNQSIKVGTTASTGNEGTWAGFRDCPVVVSVPVESGAATVSGVAEYW